MSSHRFQDLQGKLRIVPITTMDGFENNDRDKPWNQIHLDIVKTDLDRIKAYLEDGWDILGWQNQATVSDPKHPYAIGGGIASLSTAISNVIQKTLIQFATIYKKSSS
jgi:hypothetical protein